MNKIRVLLIDDDPGYTRALRQLLELEGRFEVAEENDDLKAVATTRHFQPDIIFLDVMLPNLNVAEIVERIHQAPSLVETPIVFLTCLAVNTPIEKEPDPILAKHGRLPKEVDVKEIVAMIDKQLALRAGAGRRPGGQTLQPAPVRHEVSHGASNPG